MKRKIQHNAVNNQEDEDSCTYPIGLPTNALIDRKEDQSIENSTGHLPKEAPTAKDESTK